MGQPLFVMEAAYGRLLESSMGVYSLHRLAGTTYGAFSPHPFKSDGLFVLFAKQRFALEETQNTRRNRAERNRLPLPACRQRIPADQHQAHDYRVYHRVRPKIVHFVCYIFARPFSLYLEERPVVH